jgi:hypothetical protein
VNRHIELVEAVNASTTELAHDYATFYLRGYREGRCDGNDVAIGLMIMEADMHYIELGIDRPMTGGIFHDWSAK